MSEPLRLHPLAIIFNFLKVIREGIIPIVIGLFSFRNEALIYVLLIGSGIALLLVIYSILSWYRYTYRVEDEELRIEYGILIRKKRYISKNRIQSIDLTQSVLHRIFKLVKVQVETAGSGTSAEASLSAVKLSDGEKLRSKLKGAKPSQLANDEEVEEVTTDSTELVQPTHKITFKRLFIAGSTSGSIGILLAIFVVFFSELEQFIPESFYDQTINWMIGLSILFLIGLIVSLLLVLWLLGIAGTMIKYGNFTITRNNDELFITRGLLEKKQITIPLKRIQAVGIGESIIRQPLGYVTVFAEVAGGTIDKGEDYSTVLFPIMKTNEVHDFLKDLLPDYVPVSKDLHRLPKRSLIFYLFRSSFLMLIALGVVSYFFLEYSWIPLLLLLVSIGLGWLRHHDSGYRINGDQLTIRYRAVNRITMMLFHKRIQAFEKTQHKIQKTQSLATLQFSIIGKLGVGKHYKIKDLEEETVNDLSEWYSLREKS
ncbi:PH domain-containing protein [Oceanobacillus halotolerans]|uniref:PH domain-containing protein n=1 Tax=Oceanobacillus halotolerans TaxID=2663380 RepID=UPI0013DB1FB4|nr:PH domain-containing protein [Oceanobacillus halotolerans]